MSIHFENYRWLVRMETIAFPFISVLKLKTFRYQQGRYLTIRTKINGEEYDAPTLFAAARWNELRIAIKNAGCFLHLCNRRLLDVMPP